MAKQLSSKTRELAVNLRRSGASLNEIASALNIAKSTASILSMNVELNHDAMRLLSEKRTAARIKGSQAIIEQHKIRLRKISEKSELEIRCLDLNNTFTCKLICSLLYWGEGGKVDNFVSFINSDPLMIATFMKFIRRAFEVDERKFRGLIHFHEYHNEDHLKSFWSKITKIPLSQFSKSYLKPHTGKNTKLGFMGTLKVKYFSSKIADELKAIYNTLAKS